MILSIFHVLFCYAYILSGEMSEEILCFTYFVLFSEITVLRCLMSNIVTAVISSLLSCFVIVSCERVNPVPVTPSWPEVVLTCTIKCLAFL